MAVGGKVKGITIEFDGDTTKLGNALKQIDAKAKGVDKSLAQVNRALKFNPKNTELVAQKQTLLRQKIDQTRERLEALEATQKKLDDDPSVEKDSQEYMELRREIITTESKLKHFEAEQKKLDRIKFTNLGKSFQKVGGKISSVGRTMSTTFSIISAGAIYAGKKLIDMSQKQAQAEQKLITTYKNRMGVDEKAAKSTMRLASAIQKVGVVGDEVTLSGAQQLATYAKYPSTINKILPAMDDWLVQEKGMNATQEDAVAKAKLIGKALNGQSGALTRLGISLTDAQKEILKTGTEEEKAALITEALESKFGGMNKALAETDAGKIQQAKNALGDMGEELGAVLLPAVADLVKWLQKNLMPKIEKFIEFMKEHPQIAKFALAIASITAVAGPLLIFIGSMISAIGAIIKILPLLGKAFTMAFNPIGLIIAGAIAAAILLWKNWDKVKKFLLKIWTAIKTAALTVFNFIKKIIVGYWKTIWTITKTIWTTIAKVLRAAWNGIKNAAKIVAGAIAGFFKNAWQNIKNAFKNVGSFFTKKWQAIKGAFKNVGSFFREKFSQAWQNIKGVFKNVGSFFGGIWRTIKSKFTSLGTKIGSAISGAVASGINGIIGFIERTINGGIKLINGAIKWINKIPKVNISKIKPLNLPRINWNAEGGIFDRPTVLQGVGEAGAEAVIPLDKFWRKMDAIAESNNAAPIVVNVYGSENMNVNELAVAVQNKIIQMQKRRTSAWA